MGGVSVAETDQQQQQCHCNRHPPQPDLIPIILSRCCQFSMRMTRHIITCLSPLVMILTIFLMSRSIVYSAVFMMLSAGLGLHMPTLVAGQIIYCLISLIDPFLMTLICVWALHKTAIKKKPLIDLEYWKRRIAGMERNGLSYVRSFVQDTVKCTVLSVLCNGIYLLYDMKICWVVVQGQGTLSGQLGCM